VNLAWWLAVLTTASGLGARGRRGPVAAEIADPAARLTAKLEAHQPVTVVCLGDSITMGLNLADRDVSGYPALLARMLEERWPGAGVRVLNKGVAGNATSDALARFDDDVAAAAPDLVTLQFGGNDKGVGEGLDNLPRYQQNLRRLVAACHRINAACIIMTPPMHEPVTDMPFPTAARRVGAELKVPVADIDTALKRREHDYRGFFPYFIHPLEHGHAIMALELYRAVCELIGKPLQTAVEIDDTVQEDCNLGGYGAVSLWLINHGDQPRTMTVKGDAVLPFRLDPVEVPAGGHVVKVLPLALPHTLSGGRSVELPLWVSLASTPPAADGAAPGDPEVAFGLAHLTLAPVLGCPTAGTYAARAPMATLSWPSILVGRDAWKGDRDLSGDIRLSYDDTVVHLAIDVTDDIIVTTAGMPIGDGAEIFLDLRPDADRGKPFYSRQCATLFVGAAFPPARPVVTTLSDDDTPPALLKLVPRCTAIARGYRLELDLPRAVLDQIGGRNVTRFGLDIALDDCDDGKTRKCQMVWLGRVDNFVNPGRLGEIRLEPNVPPGTVRLTVF